MPAVFNNDANTKATQAFLPSSMFTQLNGISQGFVAVTSDTNIYKLLNISYEAIITDTGIRVRNFDGVLISKTAINLSKNIITTIYESNLTEDEGERILFTTDLDTKIPVVDFGALGYGYLQLGRYHMFTPLTEDIQTLYLITSRGRVTDYTIQGVYTPTLLPVSSL